MTIPGGLLCDEIIPELNGTSWVINFGLVSLSLPSVAVEKEVDFAAFLLRRKTAQDVKSCSPWVHSLLALLSEQGCITLSSSQFSSPSGLQQLHARFSNWWYLRYYRHPVWKRLRADLSPRLFACWAKRTYYLSKSAGATAARSVMCTNRDSVRTVFLKSALEEYSHHQVFYALQPLLGKIDQSNIVFQNPTPGCIAFDDQMLSIAEHDDCAHVFVALFQEKTAGFAQQANEFYDFIERKLNIPMALTGWRTHISFDHEHGHALDLENLLKEFIDIPEQALKNSILRASATIDFLVESLNELEQTEWIGSINNFSTTLREEFLSCLGEIVVKALSHCIEQPKLLMTLGRVLDVLLKRYPIEAHKCVPTRLGVVAMLGRLEHITTQPERFFAALTFILLKLDEHELLHSLNVIADSTSITSRYCDIEVLGYAMTAWDRPINCLPFGYSWQRSTVD